LDIGVLGIIVAVLLFAVGIPLAFYIGRRNRQVPDLRVATDADALLSMQNAFNGKLTMAFDGKPVQSLARTYLAIWNHRGDTIWGRDMLASDPLRIDVGDGDEVLQVRLVARHRAINKLEATSANGSTPIAFEFLDAGDGGIFEVLHRGDSVARVVGTIPGVRFDDGYTATLGRGSRAAVRTAKLRRFSLMHRSFQRAMFFSAALAFVGLVGAVASGVLEILLFIGPELVKVSKYKLSTLGGQHDFAEDVLVRGTHDWPVMVAVGGFFVFSLINVIFFLRRINTATHAVIPRSIVLDDLDVAVPKPDSKKAL
jgi:hypothetical protein